MSAGAPETAADVGLAGGTGAPVGLWGLALGIVLLVACQRLAELVLARRNAAALRARGWTEVGAAHYPALVALHAAWLGACAWAAATTGVVHWWLLGLFLLLQLARIWTIATLGPYWTTRILTHPDAPLIRRGPYRLMRHPNYAVVAAEIVVLPLAFGAWRLAAVFGLANAALLAVRLRAERRALAGRPEASYDRPG